jgi:predicted enzyme related to lactoylglutathione lyase
MANQPLTFGAVLFAKNLSRVAKFYEEILSMAVVHSERDHIVLESPSCQLVVHAIPKQIADAIDIATSPVRRTEMPIKLFFFVPRIAAVRAQVDALGGELNPQEAEWEARGFRACDGHDPEGNVIQLREIAAFADSAR